MNKDFADIGEVLQKHGVSYALIVLPSGKEIEFSPTMSRIRDCTAIERHDYRGCKCDKNHS